MSGNRNLSEIHAADYPATAYRALTASIGRGEEIGITRDEGWWTKTVQDAQGALRDGFVFEDQLDPGPEMLNPDGVATLYVSPTHFVAALTSYAENLLTDSVDDTATEQEFPRVLHLIDKIKTP